MIIKLIDITSIINFPVLFTGCGMYGSQNPRSARISARRFYGIRNFLRLLVGRLHALAYSRLRLFRRSTSHLYWSSLLTGISGLVGHQWKNWRGRKGIELVERNWQTNHQVLLNIHGNILWAKSKVFHSTFILLRR